MPPNYLVSHTFLGKSCGGGINPTMKSKLKAVEDDLFLTYSQTGESLSFEDWCGIRESHGCWRGGAGYHSSGSAIDINYTTNPYIVTRTGGTLGGEAGTPNANVLRQAVVEVFDRAVQFATTMNDRADVSIRVSDTIEFTYDRFRIVSDALRSYLSVVIWTSDPVINRPTIAGIKNLPDGDAAFNAIPLSERYDELDGVSAISTAMSDPDFVANHPTWPFAPTQQYYQILRDYEIARTPMLFGHPAKPIVSTRNASNGFLNLRKEIVVALASVGGMRWGASDFGPSQSGDIMHFDLNGHAGYPPQDT